MAGQPMELLTGGSGMFNVGGHGAPQNIAPQNANGAQVGASASGLEAHHGVIGIVVFAVLILFILDRAGFRFAVTAGKR